MSEPVLALLQEYARERLVWIEYGLQSSHDATLAAICRGHDAATFERAVRSTAGRGIEPRPTSSWGCPVKRGRTCVPRPKFLARLPVDGVKLHLLMSSAALRWKHCTTRAATAV